MTRDDTAKVIISLRLPEKLRARIEEKAKQAGSSMNNEVLSRVERSMDDEDRSGSPANATLLRMLENAVFNVSAALERDWKADETARRATRSAILEILDIMLPVEPIPVRGLLAPDGPEDEHVSEQRYAALLGAKIGRAGLDAQVEALQRQIARMDEEIARMEGQPAA